MTALEHSLAISCWAFPAYTVEQTGADGISVELVVEVSMDAGSAGGDVDSTEIVEKTGESEWGTEREREREWWDPPRAACWQAINLWLVMTPLWAGL